MEEMKILVTGANGLLGQTIIKQLLEKKYEVVATGRGPSRMPAIAKGFSYNDIDITDGPAIAQFIIEQHPQVVVHAAAMTQVDQCELHKQDCYNINVTATRFIIDAAKADGRWDAAYASASKAEVPPDLQAALDANPAAAAFFATLTGANRYAILYRIGAVKRAETRARKIAEFVAMLERHETLH